MNFSVSLCVYHKDNPSDFKKAIESISNAQSVKPSEIIIVVDGPIYGELKEVVEYYESQSDLFKIIWLPCNIGHAGARQAGLEAASHDIIAIMDADDISLPKRFELQLKAFEELPDVAVIGGQIKEFINYPSNIVSERIVPLVDGEIKKYLRSRCPMNLMTVMIKKAEIQNIGGFIDWYCEEDYNLWIRMARAGCRFANLPETLVNVRVGKEMYRRRGGWRYFKSEARLQGYMLKHRVISFPRYLFNVAGRFAVQVAMPTRLRGFVFQKLFRK